MAAFGGTCGMDHTVESPMLAEMICQLTCETFGMAEVQLYESDTLIGEVFPATGGPHGGPHFVAFLEGAFHHITADEARGSSD